MDEQYNEATRPVNPRRRKRTKMQIFKEAYLPLIIVGLAAVLIVIFLIGSIVRAVQKGQYEKQERIDASIAEASEQARLTAESQHLSSQAKALADGFDYAGAIAALETFSGDITQYPELYAQLTEYEQAQSQMVLWDDPSQVVCLSTQLLIADPQRAFSHETYQTSFRNNFITTTEFSKILQQLYENGYILVSLDDFITTSYAEDGTEIYTPKPMYLPNGKRPLLLTQTNVNYNIYLIDSDGDKLPDAGGGGFASRMIVGSDGNITCEMVDRDGNTVTGAYDLVPILNEFVAQHPDFSYKGAKALLAMTGYNGLFGHRTNAGAVEDFGEVAYEDATYNATLIQSILMDDGYDFACYTYENIGYGESGLSEIQADLTNWNNEVVPLLGPTNVLVYAQMSDITEEPVYSGEKYEALYNAGFRYFLGFSDEGAMHADVTDNYVRVDRLLVTGANLTQHPGWFEAIFDASSVLDSARNAA